MRKTLTFMCVLGLLAWSAPAWGDVDHYFTDADTNDSNWSTPGNWSNGVVPESVSIADNAFIGSGKTCYLTVGNTGGGVPRGFRLRLGTTTGGSGVGDQDPGLGGPGTFVIQTPTDGLLDFDLSRFLHFGCHDMGTIIQNSGEVSWSDTDMSWVGMGCTNQSSRYELHSGECTWRSNMMLWQLDDGVDGVSADVIQTGGTLNVKGRNTTNDGWNVAFGTINNSSALYKISGGEVNIGDFALMGLTATCTNTTATFQVVGSAPSAINVDKWMQTIGTGASGAQSILHAEMDGGACTTITVAETAAFASGTELKVTRLASTPPPEKGDHVILTAAGGITDNGLVLTYDSTFWNVTVGATDITATFLYIPGDCALFPGTNNDVDDADLSVLLNNFGTATGMTWAHGDFNNDAGVADADLSILLAHWDTVGSVPEPATLCLLGLGAIGLLRRRRR